MLLLMLLTALGVSTVHGQTFNCLGSDLIGLDTDKASDFTTEKCQQGSGEKQYLELCPSMEVVNQTVGVDNNTLFVTCRAKQDMTVSVRQICDCEFNSKISERCDSDVSQDFNIAYVRPENFTEQEITTYIENFMGRTDQISFHCIVTNKSDPMNDEILAQLNFTINYESGAQSSLIRMELTLILCIYIFVARFLSL